MTNNYNRVAGIYDVSSRMVFGKAQEKSQTEFLKWIPPQSRILIAGGGTGWILESITAIHPGGLDILYVEASVKMMELSKERNFGDNKVSFVCSPIESCNFDGLFDVVITAYLFDNFLRAEAEVIFQLLHQTLRPGGRWLFADFYIDAVHPPLWQNLLWYTMFTFFLITCGVKAKKLVDMSPYFKKAAYKLLQEKEYYSGFIKGYAFEKNKLSL